MVQRKEKEGKGIRLLKKGQKGLVHALFSRFGLMLLLLILQIFVLFSVFQWFENLLPHFLGGTVVYTIIIVLYLLNSRLDPTAKITWLLIIMFLPVFGPILYWFTKSDLGHKAIKARVEYLNGQTKNSIPQDLAVFHRLQQENPGAALLVRYLGRNACHPIYDKTAVTYFPLGEDKWREMLCQLEQAKNFIFLEYFIVDEGRMWGEVLEVLVRKAKEGVDVRLMYDGTCEFTTLPHNYPNV